MFMFASLRSLRHGFFKCERASWCCSHKHSGNINSTACLYKTRLHKHKLMISYYIKFTSRNYYDVHTLFPAGIIQLWEKTTHWSCIDLRPHINCCLTKSFFFVISFAAMSFFDSVKKSLGISKEKTSANPAKQSINHFDQFDITFTEEKLGLGIAKYTGDFPHLSPSELHGVERSCPIVTSFDTHKFGNAWLR